MVIYNTIKTETLVGGKDQRFYKCNILLSVVVLHVLLDLQKRGTLPVHGAIYRKYMP